MTSLVSTSRAKGSGHTRPTSGTVHFFHASSRFFLTSRRVTDTLIPNDQTPHDAVLVPYLYCSCIILFSLTVDFFYFRPQRTRINFTPAGWRYTKLRAAGRACMDA